MKERFCTDIKYIRALLLTNEINPNLIANIKNFIFFIIKRGQSKVPRGGTIIDKIKANVQRENSLKYKPSSKQAWTSRTKPLKVPSPLQEG